MKPLFAILIPTTPDRAQLCERVIMQIADQRKNHPVEVIRYISEHSSKGGPTTGHKRNVLIDDAVEIQASHIAFVDSDDLLGPTYIERNMEAVYGDYDCAELWGMYYEHGRQINPFHHSIIHKEWWQDSKAFYRMPNHLSCIKLAHLESVRFQDKTVGEDFWYSEAVRLTGRLKNQYPVKEVIYHYFKSSPNLKWQETMAKRNIII